MRKKENGKERTEEAKDIKGGRKNMKIRRSSNKEGVKKAEEKWKT